VERAHGQVKRNSDVTEEAGCRPPSGDW